MIWSLGLKPNNIPRPFLKKLQQYIRIYFMFIHCMPKYMALSFDHNKKMWELSQIIFLIVMAPLRMVFLNFGN
jgi:Na+/proline symporter